MTTWGCEIGEVESIPSDADAPMRAAVAHAYKACTGAEPKFLFSGWRGALTKAQLATAAVKESHLCGTGRIWTCKIGEVDAGAVSPGGEPPPSPHYPLRQAARNAYIRVTGREPTFLFSGWGAQLTEPERAVVEDREPVRESESVAAAQRRATGEYVIDIERLHAAARATCAAIQTLRLVSRPEPPGDVERMTFLAVLQAGQDMCAMLLRRLDGQSLLLTAQARQISSLFEEGVRLEKRVAERRASSDSDSTRAGALLRQRLVLMNDAANAVIRAFDAADMDSPPVVLSDAIEMLRTLVSEED